MTYLAPIHPVSTPVLPANLVNRTPETDAPLTHVELFGLPVVSASTPHVVNQLLMPGRNSRVAFLNAHCANVMARDTTYADSLQTADMILPDGIGVELAARMRGKSIAENLNGTDFTPALLQAAADRGLSVFLFGGQPGVADEAATALCHRIPGLRIAGTRNGFDGAANSSAAIAAINASRADIVLVAMGVPRQDVWLAKNARLLDARITLGVGALFDFLAGRVQRAPGIVRRAKCEWIWRLAMEPRRMAGRYLVGNFTFLARAAKDAIIRADRVNATRRALDITIAGSALLALAPVLPVVFAAIKLDSRGPVFFRQDRIGKDGKTFSMFKFRTMRTDMADPRAAVMHQKVAQGVRLKSRTDPRITRVGQILRRWSIDELPQIVNVLRGEMSIVGPRPVLPQEYAAFPKRAMGRFAVKPGLTGIWQVSGRADIGFDKMIEMDLAYAASRTALLDLLLIFMTFKAVVAGRGAY
ncbi:sugar transferase [Chachezhania antarctica]|uniref:sugar transferase n=1 Tax=Chachezhania antarctica TaxID=2340860 RepID=UPI000EB2DEB1|nr:WecB/TagA/CpsF family glycosyltransferase [Chachezhania antarctica]|tara:strand:- start:2405 stop:3820 length:1416 start_codon:yes stop_codon:yes gene_type:complete